MNIFFQFWGMKPRRKLWILLPLSYTLFLQILTGFPKPGSLKDRDAHELFVRFSEELFAYPFWLQDLSHLPLFFGLAWLWSWQLGPVIRLKNTLFNKAAVISYSYAVINEMIQAFIPDRFPSPGDLIMNVVGVFLGLLTHSILSRKIKK